MTSRVALLIIGLDSENMRKRILVVNDEPATVHVVHCVLRVGEDVWVGQSPAIGKPFNVEALRKCIARLIGFTPVALTPSQGVSMALDSIPD